MKVILLRDVAKLGRRNEIVVVADGYGMNKLVPAGLAKPATPENIKAHKSQVTSAESAKVESAEAFKDLVTALTDVTVTITMEANEEGRLFQAVKAGTIAVAISKKVDREVKSEQVVLGDPIKSTGEHVITIASGVETIKQSIIIEAA